MQILDLKQMDITKSRFYQEVIQEGRLQGLEQGLQRGEAQLVIRLLDPFDRLLIAQTQTDTLADFDYVEFLLKRKDYNK